MAFFELATMALEAEKAIPMFLLVLKTIQAEISSLEGNGRPQNESSVRAKQTVAKVITLFETSIDVNRPAFYGRLCSAFRLLCDFLYNSVSSAVMSAQGRHDLYEIVLRNDGDALKDIATRFGSAEKARKAPGMVDKKAIYLCSMLVQHGRAVESQQSRTATAVVSRQKCASLSNEIQIHLLEDRYPGGAASGPCCCTPVSDCKARRAHFPKRINRVFRDVLKDKVAYFSELAWIIDTLHNTVPILNNDAETSRPFASEAYSTALSNVQELLAALTK